MTQNPIRFLSEDGDPKVLPDTEMGGASGLIQPALGQSLRGDPGASGGHDLEASDVREVIGEVAGIVHRAAMRVGSTYEQTTGLPDSGDDVVRDPHTGRVAPDSKNKPGGEVGAVKGELSSLKP